jgi:hypothetical protein
LFILLYFVGCKVIGASYSYSTSCSKVSVQLKTLEITVASDEGEGRKDFIERPASDPELAQQLEVWTSFQVLARYRLDSLGCLF